MGVEFVCDVAVGTDITLNDLDNQYNAVFLAIGTWKESWVYLPGTELKGVMPALLFLEARGQGGAGARWAARWPSSAAATRPSIRPAPRSAWAPR